MELTDEIDTLGVAMHEVGHGLAAVKGGLHVKRLRIKRSWWTGKVSCGYTLLDPPTKDAPASLWQAYAVMLFVGSTAQLRFYEQAGVLTSSVQANVERGASGDYQFWVADKARCGISEAEARTAANHFCDRHWPRLTDLAERLADRMQLAGSAL